jgi:HK97 family phage major capsid protein
MTPEEIHARMQAILDAAEGRQLTDAEADEYERLEGELVTAQRTTEIRARQQAYNSPAPGQGLVSPVAPAREDDGLERAFEAYLRSGVPNADIAGLRVSNTQSEGSGPAGGYTVPTQFRQKLVEVRAAFGGFAAEAETLNTTNGQPIEYPTLDDTANSGTITPENAAVSGGADMVFGTVSLGAFKYTSSGDDNSPLRVPVELLQDTAFAVGDLVARKLGERIARKQSPDFVTGLGAGQPKGILASTLTQDADLDTADAVTYNDLVDLQDVLDEAYDAGAKWLMRRNTWTQIRKIIDTAGRPIVQSSTEGIAGRPERRLLDRPVVIDEAAPLLSSAGITLPIAYGDFREAYVVRRVASLVVVVNPYSRAEYGQVEYTAWERADGQIQNRKAYVILRNNT